MALQEVAKKAAEERTEQTIAGIQEEINNFHQEKEVRTSSAGQRNPYSTQNAGLFVQIYVKNYNNHLNTIHKTKYIIIKLRST